ncbi:MAG: hypothetical protein Q8P42_09780 [Gallionella sp.]|nr:hypothetical protein [Gallionella sp.]
MSEKILIDKRAGEWIKLRPNKNTKQNQGMGIILPSQAKPSQAKPSQAKPVILADSAPGR